MRIKNLLVVLVSTLVGLLFWEAGLRLFSHYGPHDAAQPASVCPPNPRTWPLPRVTSAGLPGPAAWTSAGLPRILRPCRTGRRPAPPLPAAIGTSSAAASSALRGNMSGTAIW